MKYSKITLVIFSLLFVVSNCLGQLRMDKDFLNKKKKQYLVQGSLALASGALDGVKDIVQFKYHKFRDVHPNANEQFWNPQVSWKNKWKNGDINQGEKFFGSSTFLVATTDSFHLLKSAERSFLVAAVVVNLGRRQKWYWYLIDFAFITLTRNIGFNATYRFIYKGDSP